MAWHETADGTRLHYVDEGIGDPTIVCVHGGFSNLTHWDPLAQPLALDHRVIRMDLRGHGHSDAPDEGYSISQFATDVAGLLRSLDVHEAVVIGHSMGGMIAVEMARQHRDVTGAVVLVDSSLQSRSRGRERFFGPSLQLLGGNDYKEQMRRMYRKLFHPEAPRELVDRVCDEAAETPQHVALACLQDMYEFDASEVAYGLELPILMVRLGGHIPDPEEADISWTWEGLPHLQYAQVVASGHFVMLEVPDQLVPMVRRFLELPNAQPGTVQLG